MARESVYEASKRTGFLRAGMRKGRRHAIDIAGAARQKQADPAKLGPSPVDEEAEESNLMGGQDTSSDLEKSLGDVDDVNKEKLPPKGSVKGPKLGKHGMKQLRGMQRHGY